MILVVDASAAAEYLLRTDLGERIGALLEGARLFAPELLDVEVLSVLRREVLRRTLKPSRAEEAVDDLAAWHVERISHRGLLEGAWSLRANLSAYDSVYVAAARALGAELVTADGPLSRAPGLGVAVHNLRI
jgi:predicted nucleic acid-binding protein